MTRALQLITPTNETHSGAKPLAIDLFCGLGGWTEGLLAEGWAVIGFDIEAHAYDGERYPAQLVLQDVLTLHGSQFRTADLIVASPPCQFFSYTAMPWTRAKALAAEVRADAAKLAERLAPFRACFRIQREACEAAGRHIPLVVENVKGAQPWVGRAAWAFGSYYLWGDLPALMPVVNDARKVPGFRFDGSGRSFQTASVNEAIKNAGGSWFNVGSPGQKQTNRNPVHAITSEGVKARDADGYERTHPAAFGWKAPRTTSKGAARKAASAKVAKIPRTLSQHIGRVYLPREQAA